MWIADLQPLIEPKDNSEFAVLAVGWLDRTKEFPVCEKVLDGFLPKLKRLAFRCRAAVTRGYHTCPFCLFTFEEVLESVDNSDVREILLKNKKECREELITNPFKMIEVTDEERTMVLGSAEIWVPGEACIYAAPNLILHYVEKHAYSPPPSFIDAVNNFHEDGDWNVDVEYAKYF